MIFSSISSSKHNRLPPQTPLKSSSTGFIFKVLLSTLSAICAAVTFFSYTQYQQHNGARHIIAQQQTLSHILPVVYSLEQATGALHAQALRQIHQNAFDLLLDQQQQVQKKAQNLFNILLNDLSWNRSMDSESHNSLLRMTQELVAQTSTLDSAFANQTLSPQTLARYAQLFESSKNLTNAYLQALGALHPYHSLPLVDSSLSHSTPLETLHALIVNERAHTQLYTRLWTHLHRAPFTDPNRPPLFLPQVGQPLPPLTSKTVNPTPIPTSGEVQQHQQLAQNATAPLSNEQRYELVHEHFALTTSFQKLDQLLHGPDPKPASSERTPFVASLLDAQSFLQSFINATERSERLTLMSPISTDIAQLTLSTQKLINAQLQTLSTSQPQPEPLFWGLFTLCSLTATFACLIGTVFIFLRSQRHYDQLIAHLHTLWRHQSDHALDPYSHLSAVPTAFQTTQALMNTQNTDSIPQLSVQAHQPLSFLYALDALWTFSHQRCARVFQAANAQLTQAQQDHECQSHDDQEQLQISHEKMLQQQQSLDTLYALHQQTAQLLKASNVQLPQMGLLVQHLHTTHTSTQQLFDQYEHKLAAIDKWQQSVKEQVELTNPLTREISDHLSKYLQDTAKTTHLCHKIHQQCTDLFNLTLTPNCTTHTALRQGLIQLQSYCNTLNSVSDTLGNQSAQQHAHVRSLVTQTQKITHITHVGSTLARQSAQLQKRFLSQQYALQNLSDGLRRMHQHIQDTHAHQLEALETLHQALQKLPVHHAEQLNLHSEPPTIAPICSPDSLSTSTIENIYSDRATLINENEYIDQESPNGSTHTTLSLSNASDQDISTTDSCDSALSK